MHISIAAEELFTLWGLHITNTVFTGFIVLLLVVLLIFVVNTRLSRRTPNKLQVFFEIIIEYLGTIVYDLVGKRRGDKMLGLLFTFMFFILISNWFGLLPIVPSLVYNKSEGNKVEVLSQEEANPTLGSCLKEKNCFLTINGIEVFEEPVHVLRAPTSDLSMTIALAILAVAATTYSGLKVLKFGYIKKFLNFSNPMDGFVGLLELLSEFIKIISFSFRLFGNIFAGELLLTIITSLTYGIATIPFLFLETFVGFIQALVFFMLLAIFISLAVQPHSAEH